MNKTDKDIKDYFASIAYKYDFLNQLFSLHFDKLWRKKLLKYTHIYNGAEILDICTGTADIALEFAERKWVKKITGIDFSEEMLVIGRKKIKKKNLNSKISLINADALNLPFKKEFFHIITSAFGFRNLTDRAKGLAEMFNVLKGKGQVLILEFSSRQNGIFKIMYRFYLNIIMPIIGGLFSGSFSAYKHLASSITDFPQPKEILNMFNNAGFKQAYYKKIMFGIVYLYIAIK